MKSVELLMDELSDVNRDRVCVATVYNLKGYFELKDNETITKKTVEKFLRMNIKYIVGEE